MKSKRRFSCTTYVLLIMIFGSPLRSKAQVEIFLDGPVQQVVFAAPQPSGLSMTGYIQLGSVNNTDSVYFTNIFLFVPGPDTIIWVGQNIPIPPDHLALAPTEFYLQRIIEINLDPLFLFPAGQPQFLPQVDLAIAPPSLQPFLEPIPLPSISNFQPFPVEPFYHYVEINPVNPSDLVDILTHGYPIEPVTISWQPPITLPPFIVARGCNMPNIDLDSSTHGPTATYAGDLNACVPAGTANSFMWLRDQHMEIDSLLNLAHGDDDTTHRRTLEDLSGVMGRANNAGVFSIDHARAKQTFVDKHKLPVKVKFQSVFEHNDLLSGNDTYGHAADNQNGATDEVDPCWIFDELADDEDVEMNFQCHWVDSLGQLRPDNPATPANENLSYAHCVALTGAMKIDIPGGGFLFGLSFKHDLRQDSVTGLKLQYSGLGETMIGGKKYSELTGKGGRRLRAGGINYTERCIVGSVMSESFDATVTFDSIPCPPNLTFNGDTLSTGVYKGDTICLSNVVIRPGQEVKFKCNVFKADPTFTQTPPTSTMTVDNSGCP